MAPILTSGAYTGQGASATMYQVRHYTMSATGVTFGIRNTVDWTGSVFIHFLAAQMNTSFPEGLAAMPMESPEGVEIRNLLATCHVAECENFEKPLVLLSPDGTDYVICGPCGTHYEDVVQKGVLPS